MSRVPETLCGLATLLFLALAPPSALAAGRDAPCGERPSLLHVGSPSWRDQVIYMLFIDRFDDGDRSNNDQGYGEYDPGKGSHFNGGDLQGVINRLDYLQSLGVTAVWITPPVMNQWWSTPYQAAGWHGYWGVNFKEIDPHFGALDDYKRLSHELHCRGMYLIQDIVANHTANFYTYDGGYDPEDTAKNFRLLEPDSHQSAPTQPPFHMIDRLNPEHAKADIYHWTPTLQNYSDRYQETNYMLGYLADLNTENPRVIAELKDTYKYWISEVGVDGFRVDTAMLVEHEFWHRFLHDDDGIYAHARKLGKAPFLTFGESVSVSAPFQDEGERKLASYMGTQEKPYLNSMLGYPLYTEINRVIGQGQPPRQLAWRLSRAMTAYNDPHVIPNFIDNHDTPRFLATGSTAAFEQALALLFSIPGIPILYQGTEQAFTETRSAMFKGGFHNDTGSFNPASRPYQLIRELAALRRSHPHLPRAGLEIIAAEEAGPGILAYRRGNSSEGMIVLMNTADHAVLAHRLGAGVRPKETLKPVFSLNGTDAIQVDSQGLIDTVLPPRSVFISAPAPLAEAPAAVPSPATDLRIESPESGGTFSRSFVLSGSGGSMGELMLIQDGNMDSATLFQPDNAGAWKVEVPVVDLGASDHYLQVYDAQRNQLSERFTYTRQVEEAALEAAAADAKNDDAGPDGTYIRPLQEESRRQKDIEFIRARTAGANLELTLRMSEVSDRWIPVNGFDNVVFSIFFDTEPGAGVEALPGLNARMPDGRRWNFAHVASGWASYMYVADQADAHKQGVKLGLSPAIRVDKPGRTITLLYEGGRMGIESWQNAVIYITTWEHSAEGEYVDIRAEPGEWVFGGGAATSPKVLDDATLILTTP